MAAKVRQRSRLRFYDLVELDGYEFWNNSDLPEIPVQIDDQLYRVTGIDRIDLLAYRFYGDPVLWWVIAVANDIELPQVQLNEGDVIRIPSVAYVQQELFKKAVF
jgi:hypothetical protein